MGSSGLVSQQVRSIDSAQPALRHGNLLLTYGELNHRANQLAAFLTASGAGPSAPVAICMGRSFDWVIAALATFRIGSHYVPMDPAWPEERLRFVADDSEASHIITTGQQNCRFGGTAKLVDLVKDAAEISKITTREPANEDPDRLAYIIYTSGSSGYPKGVEITQANLTHLVDWHRKAFNVTSADRATHLAGLSFDAAVWELWPYLASGACVSLADETTRLSPELLQRWLLAEEITISFVPTALATPLVALTWPEKTSLRFLLTGGDTLHRRPKPALSFKVVNNYGPTECTVVASSGVVDPGSDETLPTIGRAIAGTTIYVLDEKGNRVPHGVVGEIYIGGSGVGRGYRNLPEMTSRSFGPDPFASDHRARMYRTGDRGLIRPNGEIEFHGRMDTQEKIRGQRVELEEISSVLYRHAKVDFATVIAKSADSGEKRLLAYVLPAKQTHLTSNELQEFLSQSLPDFMIPTVFIRLKALPLSHNGKIDRSVLESPRPDNLLPAAISEAPESAIAEMMLGIVRNLLGTDAIAVDDDFFLAGGHSLLGTQLILRIRSALDVDVSLRDLFEARTIARLSKTVERRLVDEVEALTEEEALRQVETSL